MKIIPFPQEKQNNLKERLIMSYQITQTSNNSEMLGLENSSVGSTHEAVG